MKTGSCCALTSSLLLLFCCGFFLLPSAAHGVFFKKEFRVCRDQGLDILCDPYVLQENDYVIKLFKQRGKIAREDFPRFLEIFKRINPDIDDIDKIYAGQRILIPLKVLPPGTLMGQQSGAVSLPIVMISDLPELMEKKSSVYEVRAGDTVWDLIVERFGGLDQREYLKLKEMVKFMNPQLPDINRLDIGDRIRLPLSSVRNTLWYDAIFDKSGGLRSHSQARASAGGGPSSREKPEKPAANSASGSDSPERSVSPGSGQAAEVSQDAGLPAQRQGANSRGSELRSVCRKAARVLKADLLDQGDFFFPRDNGPDVRVRLDKAPVLQLSGGVRLLFDHRGLISEEQASAIRRHWPDFSLVQIDRDASLRDVFDTICPFLDKDGCKNRLEFFDGGMHVTVRGEFIFERPGGGGKMCLTFIEEQQERTPPEICRYLAHHWIGAADWIHRPERFAPACTQVEDSMIVENAATIAADSASGFVRRFVKLLGYNYHENVDISFPYAGFQVKATVDLVSADSEHNFLLDYGWLQGHAVESIETTGLPVIQIRKEADFYRIAKKLLSEFPVQQSRPQLFWAADRRRIHNTSIRIPGTVIHLPQKSGKEKKILLSSRELPPEIQYFLCGKGVKLIQIHPETSEKR
ncbi:MAG: hypothetical protein R6X08_13075 [Desulfosalsimonadaceae bacterium]